MTKPIDVTTEVTINHWELGKAAADWNSDEQGMFLHGMTTGLDDLRGAGHIQLHYVVQGLQPEALSDVRRFVELLANYFKEE